MVLNNLGGKDFRLGFWTVNYFSWCYKGVNMVFFFLLSVMSLAIYQAFMESPMPSGYVGFRVKMNRLGCGPKN